MGMTGGALRHGSLAERRRGVTGAAPIGEVAIVPIVRALSFALSKPQSSRYPNLNPRRQDGAAVLLPQRLRQVGLHRECTGDVRVCVISRDSVSVALASRCHAYPALQPAAREH